jgi:hypothetical protein
MARRKTLKEYAIRLNHPEFGDFYYQYNTANSYYSQSNNYYFTQNLSKVETWKTLKFAEAKIKEINERLKNKQAKVLLSFGKEPKEELKSKMIVSRKKYYYPIASITSKVHVERAKENLDRLNESLIKDSRMITRLIKKSKHVEKSFIDIFKKLSNDIDQYRKDHNYLEKNKNCENVFLDIVDASYSFRLLKLKTLRKVQSEDEVQS